MSQSTRWGVAASVATLLFAGCSGADKNPVQDGQSLTSQVMRRQSKFDAVLPIEGAQTRKERLPVRQRQGQVDLSVATTPAEATGEVVSQRPGNVIGTLGTFRLEIDENLNAEVVFPRTAQTQGDKYLLGIDQFFRPGNVRVTGIARDGDNLDVSIRFNHPFPRPADLLPPATSTKRLDLHVFNVWAGLLIQGTESYFGGTVTTNTSVLANADSYRQTGGLITLPGGVTANVFPGKWIADQSAGNTDPASDNYDPADNGWENTELQDPTGFGVFHQGDSETITFSLNTAGSPLSLDMAVIADYQDPRATPVPKNNRLPDPTDPTKLRYILPYGAGDLQSVATNVEDTLEGTSLVTATVSIVDLDADAGVAASFPNESNLSEMPFASGIDSVDTSFPTGITASTASEGTGSGTGLPSSPKVWEFQLSNTGAVADGDYRGMIRVVDEENDNLASETYLQLDPNLTPLASQIPIQVYQTVDFTVGPATGGCTGSVTINAEIDAADPSYAITDGWTGPLVTQHPYLADKITGIIIDQVSGAPALFCHGPFSALYGTPYWGAGFFIPVDDGLGNINIQIIQFRNSASAPVIDQPKARPDINRGYIVADGRIDPAASSASGELSFWAPYPAAVPTGRGWMGHTDQYNRLISPLANNGFYGRPFVSYVYDAQTFMTNFATWAGTYPTPMGGVPLIFSDLYGTSAGDIDPFPAHDPLTQQGFNVDVATYYGDPLGAGTRDANFRHLGQMSAIRGTAVATFDALPANTNAWEFWAILDVDDPGTATFEELWGEFIQVPTLNTEEGAGAVMGAGPGSVNQNTTTGFDFARDAASVFVIDSTDDTVERYNDVIIEGGADTGITWTYSGVVSDPGAIVDPIDITVTKNNYVVVLDNGGPSGSNRLVVLDPDTLCVLGTRNIADPTTGEITSGAIGIAADDSLLNIPGDASAFCLVWDAPTIPVPEGGLIWYTIAAN